ncbi:MAG: hypothetical protein SFV81_03670 [Pirellulaceae bacterium]|nr:hypothetical protein [Pirellulaceae bacterium]
MSPQPTSPKRFASVAGPALGIAIAYYFVFHSPLQRSLLAERTKLHKLETASARRAQAESLTEKLAKAESDIRLLNEQISESKEIGSHLVTRRADLRSEFLQSSSPALVMAETLALLKQHGLECLHSSPVAEQNNTAPLAESLKPVAVLLGDAANSGAESLNRREMRMTLRGRFQDVQSALREIQAAPLGIFTVSLEMEDSDARTDVRIWILTIAV